MLTAQLGTRAVGRPVHPGDSAYCAHCPDPITFAAKTKRHWIVCNVYEDCGVAGDHHFCACQGRGTVWDRRECFHPECYEAAGLPHGEVAWSEAHYVREKGRIVGGAGTGAM